MNAFTDFVKTSVILFLVLQVLPSLSIRVNIENNVNKIAAKTKIPIAPITVQCYLNDVIKLSVPLINKDDLHYILRPNGKETQIKLNTQKPLSKVKTINNPYSNIGVTFLKKSYAIIKQDNYGAYPADEFEEKLKYLDPNEFLVGPIITEDFGNWVLSTYTKDLDDEWIELFQVITMDIREPIRIKPEYAILNVGDTFNLSFAYPIPDITSCEIVAPRTTYDRFYNRSATDFNKCGFTIPNITKEDGGLWQITGVGRIIYEGEVVLHVDEANSTTETTIKTKRRKRLKQF